MEIDLIPDVIPILGYLDDLVLVPAGIALVVRLIPAPVMAECRAQAQARLSEGRPTNRVAAAVIVAAWLVVAGLLVARAVRLIRRPSPRTPRPACPGTGARRLLSGALRRHTRP